MIRSYEDLLVWQHALALITLVYERTRAFPPDERFGLVSQLRRSAVSIPSNIAEGQGRRTRGEFLHFLGQARGSLLELETQLRVAERLGMLDRASYESLRARTGEIGRLLNGLMRSLRESER